MINFLEKLVFALGWLRIVFSPLALGVIAGFISGQAIGGTNGKIVCGIISFAGLVIGVIWAERVRRTKGSMNYFGEISGTTDFDGKRIRAGELEERGRKYRMNSGFARMMDSIINKFSKEKKK